MASRKHQLCRICATRFDNPQAENFKYEGTHHENYATLEHSAERGCYICTRLRIAIQKELGSESTRSCLMGTNYQVRPTHDLREWKLDFILDLGHRSIEAPFIVLDYIQYPRADFNPQIPPNTLDPGCMSLARAWLLRCREHHTCQTEFRSTIQGIFPTRLLHVWRSRSGLINTRLQYSRALPKEAEYLTLSHMWGDQKFLTLTTRNHDGFLQSIPLDSLSQTFRDALHVTMELGFQYLWIDSLCILQDDERDWKNESERMASIYKNAACNLCASTSTSNRDGLLAGTRALDPLPPLIQFDGDTACKTKLLSEAKPWNLVQDSPLYQRAWVLQEQILAARAIHFGPEQMHWECAEAYANEVWPLGWPVIAPDDYFGPARSPFFRRFLTARSEKFAWHITVDRSHQNLSSPASRHLTWTRIVEDYSSRAITYPSDRFPALAGLIGQFSQLESGERCFAGIWEPHAHNQLLWRQVATLTASQSATPPIAPDWSLAPSWSWASINTAVKWDVHVDDVENYVSSIAMKPQSKKQLPLLHIRGYLLQLPLQECDSVPNRSNPTVVTAELYYRPYRLRCKYILDSWFLEETPVSAARTGLIDTRYLVHNTILLPILWHRFVFHSIKCLLLWKDPALEEGSYRRVGIVVMQEGKAGNLKHFYPKKDFIYDLYAHSVDVLDMDSADSIEDYDDGSCLLQIR